MALQLSNNGELRLVLRVKDDGSVVVEKFADTADRSAKKSSKAFDDFASGAGVSFRSIAAYAGVAAAAIVAFSTVGVAKMVKAQIDVADATGKAAAKLGATTEALSALALQAEITANMSLGTLTQAMHTMGRNLSDAAQGAGDARFAIMDLGLDAQKLAQMKPEAALAAIGDQLDKLPNQFDRLRIAQDIFRNTDMVNVLRGGAGAMREFYTEAEKAGKIVANETAKAANEFNDNVTRLNNNLQGMAASIMKEVVPALVRMTDAMLGNENLDSLMRKRAELAVKLQSIQQSPLIGGLAGVTTEDLRREIDDIDNRIIAANRKLQEQADRAAALANDPDKPSGTGSRERVAREEEAAKAAADAARKRAEAEVEQRVRMFEQVEALRESLLTERGLIEQHEADKQLLLFEAWEQRLVTDQQYEQMRVQIAAQAAEQRQEVERRTTDAIRNLQASVVQNAAGLAQVFAGQSKGAAILAITITKALAIAQTLAHTKTAAMLAFASQLIPGDPTSIARAKAAYATTMKLGALNAVLIGAQGFAEISQLGDGGAERGSAANPINTAPAVTPFQSSQSEQSQTVVQVIVQGNVIGNEQYIDDLAAGIRDRIDNRDLLLFGGQSRQAQEIIDAA